MRLLIGIANCHKAIYSDAFARHEPPNNAACADASRVTWIPEARASDIDVKFFFGRGATREPLQDEVFLNCDDSYDGLVEKTTAMAAWAYNHGYDFLLKTDVDSYINVKNLMASEFFEWDYAGRGWGLGYLISRTAMRVIMNDAHVRSWAEDSHVLRSLLAWGSLGNEIRLYGDGRFVFLPNMSVDDLPLFDTAFVAVNPMTPQRIQTLHQTRRLYDLLPIQFSVEDIWVGFPERIPHSRVLNAFAIRREPCPVTYPEWVKLTPYERQPYLDWTEVVNACLETNFMEDCPSFKSWLGPVEHRKFLMSWAKDINIAANKRLEVASKKFKDGNL